METKIPRGLLISALLVILIWGLWAARPFLIPVSVSGLLAFMMTPLIRLMRRVHIPEWAAIVLSVLVLLLPLVTLAFLGVRQARLLFADFPHILAVLNDTFASFASSTIGKRFHLTEYLSGSSLSEWLTSSTAYFD
jgi:predicted PurR-regulated permease PerM